MAKQGAPTRETGAADRPAASMMSAERTEFVYRPIHGMAVLSIVLALASLVSFLNYYLLAPAVLILIVSIWTTVKLDRAKSEYQGQLLAKLAVFVSLTSTLGAGTAHVISYMVITSSARNWAEQYLNAVLDDELERAFFMTLMPHDRQAFDNDPGKAAAAFNPKYQEFKTDDVVRFLRTLGSQEATIECLKTTAFGRLENLDLVGLLFRVRLNDSEKTTFLVELNVHGGVHSAWAGRQWYMTPNNRILNVTGKTSDGE